MTAMDTLTTSSSFADDYSASRQADAIEAGSILISLANSHKPVAADNKQELEAISKHHRSYSSEDRHHSPPTAPHTNDHEHYRRPMSIHNLLSDDRSTQLDSPPLRPMHRRRSSIEDQKAPVQYHSSPPIVHKRSLESEDYAMSMKRSSITRETREYSIPPRYSSDYDRHAGNNTPTALPNGKPVYRDNVDDPYRSRKDHKFNNADAYRYDHMSNKSQQRQQPPQQQPSHHHHSTLQHSRKTSMSSSLPQKYYAMKQSPNVKRNATHAYISYTIFMDITRRASIKHQLANDDPVVPYDRAYHTQYSPTPKFDRPPTMYFNAPQPPRKQSQQYSRPPSERRRSSMSYSHYPASSSERQHNESPSQPPSRYRPPPANLDMYQAPPPQQQLMTQPLTAYLRDRNTGVPR
ncbi:hypothetical protein K450DRAFT_244714 [Umbelopsis ramanniana AG]|uniref:Uncharacterized protein n=1 Tax=Umbelopsis ramanniana AG TaxID=1314678 RepID=A0AAD5E7K1_UMBRA|nr:uncharacterized protein K450DRAFT_244714 [Umbelopsis ramanniana AG]KAI8578826.1 hypothetical protein K450DRAFT_244714 [Umbelopsis ramanniana AG]